MDNKYLQNKFIEADKAMENKDFIAYYNCLTELYSNLTCNCFLKNQDQFIFEKHLEIINRITDEQSSFELNLIKGYLNLKVKKENKSYQYLTNAIAINNRIDLPFILRALISKKINPSYQEDAENAVLLKPTAHNYFVLANTLDYEKEDKRDLNKALVYYGNAIKLNPNFACAHNNRGHRYAELKDYDNAVKDFIKCFELEKSHWVCYHIWYYSDELKNYPLALKYAKFGANNNPNDIEYDLILGHANERVGNYFLAINHYSKYLQVFPDNSFAKTNLELVKGRRIVECNCLAIKGFDLNKFNSVVTNCEEVIKLGGSINGYNLRIYLESILKLKNSSTVISAENKIYKEIYQLIVSNKIAIYENYEVYVEILTEYKGVFTIRFGKYSGKDLNYIISNDPNYILWCVINIGHFYIDNLFFLKQELKVDRLYYMALEYNLIKGLLVKGFTSSENNNLDDSQTYSDDIEGDWGGLSGEEAFIGYWNTQ